MSRYYRMEVDIYPIYTGMEITSRKLLDGFGMEIDGDTELKVGDQKALCYYGHMSLSGGHTPDDAHMEMVAMFESHPDFVDEDVRLATRWLCLDNLEWDEVIGNVDPEDEE